MYDEELVLINEVGAIGPPGIQTTTPVYKHVLCTRKNVSQKNMLRGRQAGLNPEITLMIHEFEYSGEEKVRYRDKVYKVIETYTTGMDELNLIVEQVAGVR